MSTPSPVEVEQPTGGTSTEEDVPWVVLVWNDPINLMSYVAYVFQKLFGYSKDKAEQLMLQVHHEGRGVCGVYPRDLAATRIAQVGQYARARQHPLQCVMEPV